MRHLLDARPRLALDFIREFSRRMRTLHQKYFDESLQAERLAFIGLAAELASLTDRTEPQRAKAKQTISRQITRITALLRLVVEPAQLQIEVEDNGEGSAPEIAQKLFETSAT